MAEPQARDDRQSGTLRCQHDALRYACATQEIWRISVADIAAVGEFTLPLSQVRDDYFLVFVTSGGEWHRASCEAQGLRESLVTLSERLGYHLELGLANSTQLRSRVIWPEALANCPLLVSRPLVPTTTLDRVRCLLRIPRRELVLSSQVLQFLGLSPSGHAA